MIHCWHSYRGDGKLFVLNTFPLNCSAGWYIPIYFIQWDLTVSIFINDFVMNNGQSPHLDEPRFDYDWSGDLVCLRIWSPCCLFDWSNDLICLLGPGLSIWSYFEDKLITYPFVVIAIVDLDFEIWSMILILCFHPSWNDAAIHTSWVQTSQFHLYILPICFIIDSWFEMNPM